MRFQKGQTGNPKGRQAGSSNHATRVCEWMSEAEVETIVVKAIILARNGDSKLAKLCLDRVMPATNSRPTRFEAPRIKALPDLELAIQAVTAKLITGETTREEADSAIKVLKITSDVLNRRGIRLRIAELKKSIPQG